MQFGDEARHLFLEGVAVVFDFLGTDVATGSEEKMPRLVAELHAQFAESAKLEQAIKANLGRLLNIDPPKPSP